MRKQITRLAASAILTHAVVSTEFTFGQSFVTKSWSVGNTGREWLASGNWSPTGTPNNADDLFIGSGTATFHDLVDFGHTSSTGSMDTVSAHTVTFASDALTQLAAHEAISNAANGKTRILSLYGAGTATSSASGVTVMSLSNTAASTLYLGGTSAKTGSLTIRLDYSGQSKWDVADGKTLAVTGDITVADTNTVSGGIIKTGAGKLILGRNGGTTQGGGHTFTGGFTLADGTVQVGVVDDGKGVFGFGPLTLSGGALLGTQLSSAVGNNVVVNGNVSITGMHFQDYSRVFDLSGGNRTITVGTELDGVTPGVTNLSQQIHNGRIVKAGVGTLLIPHTNTNTYSGVTLQGGGLEVEDSISLGTGPLIVESGSLAGIYHPTWSQTSNGISVTQIFNPMQIGTLLQYEPLAGSYAYSGSVQLDLDQRGSVTLTGSTATTIEVGTGHRFELNADLVGSCTLVKTGAGRLTMGIYGPTSGRSFTGTLQVDAGTLQISPTAGGNTLPAFSTLRPVVNNAVLQITLDDTNFASNYGPAYVPELPLKSVLAGAAGSGTINILGFSGEPIALRLSPDGSSGTWPVAAAQQNINLAGWANPTYPTNADFVAKLILTQMASGSKQSVTVANSLTIGTATDSGKTRYTGIIDVTANDMIVRAANAGIAAANLVNLSDMARSGLNEQTSNLFTGTGIISSVAQADAAVKLRYSVGVVPNNFEGSPLFTLFDDQTVGTTDVLIKFTYFGDADLNGVVDDTDYFLTSDGLYHNLGGWLHGDFNYDGVVTDTDYFLLNNGFRMQHEAGLVVGASLVGDDSWWRALIKPGMPYYDESVEFFTTGYWPSNPYSDLTGASGSGGSNFGGRNVPEPGAAMAGVLIGCGSMRRRRR
jgi:Passenger-associated-transport-repeat